MKTKKNISNARKIEKRENKSVFCFNVQKRKITFLSKKARKIINFWCLHKYSDVIFQIIS